MSTTVTTRKPGKRGSAPARRSAPEPSSATAASATYLYCIVKSDGAFAGALAGPEGGKAKVKAKPKLEGKPRKAAPQLASAGPTRAIDVGDGYHIVVATVPLAVYSAAAIEDKLRDLDWVGAAASAHETVVERSADRGTVVPMKLFTIFSSDDRAADHVRRMKRGLEKVVARIAGCEEWGLRILFDESRAAKVKEASVGKAAAKAPVTGTSFLLRKKAHDESRRRLTSDAKREVDELFVRLERASKSAVRRPPPNRDLAGQVLLDAVFLVVAERIEKFKSTVASSAKDLAKEGYHVTLTGPWPAYSFIEGR